jgi:flagellar biosynthesis chaperone FliJ
MDTRQIEGKRIETAKADSRNMDELSIKNFVARINIMTTSEEEKVKL